MRSQYCNKIEEREGGNKLKGFSKMKVLFRRVYFNFASRHSYLPRIIFSILWKIYRVASNFFFISAP